MYKDTLVLDVHGHITTPPEFAAYAAAILAQGAVARPLQLSDERLDGALKDHLQQMDVRCIDVQLLGQRPVQMFHWIEAHLQTPWCRTTNDVIAQAVRLHPTRFLGMAQLPQNAAVNTRGCAEELERCVREHGFVGAYLNPDPDGKKQAPGVDDEYRYPLYEAAQKLDVVLMVHPSRGFDPRLKNLLAHYQINNVTEEYIATQLFSRTDIFERFPELRVVICHCGGALDRWVKTDQHMGQKDFSKNLFYDTCAHEEAFLTAAIKQRGVDQMLFGSEAPGAGGRPRPDTGRPADDLVPVIDTLDFLSMEDKIKIFNGNPKRVFPKLQSLK